MKTIILKLSLLCLCLIFLFACVVIPKKMDLNDGSCKLVTRQLTLEVQGEPSSAVNEAINEMDRLSRIDCDEPVCLLLFAPYITVGVGSTVISGSIMVVNNTIHWIEKEGRCDDGMIRSAISDLAQIAANTGGYFITKAGDLISWFKNNL